MVLSNQFNVENPEQAAGGFHGTMSDFKSDKILPPSKTGASSSYIGLGDQTYFYPRFGGANNAQTDAQNEQSAWTYAQETSRNQSFGQNSNAEGRPRVHLTAPQGQQQLDVNHMQEQSGGQFDDQGNLVGGSNKYTEKTAPRIAPEQQIVGTNWTPPSKFKGGWTQGTIPNINWNQFNAPNWVDYDAEGVPHDQLGQNMAPGGHSPFAPAAPQVSAPIKQGPRQEIQGQQTLPGMENYGFTKRETPKQQEIL